RKRQQEKAASLQQFQDEAEKESCVAMQYSGSVVQKNTCVFRSHHTPVICRPGASTSLAEQQKMQTEPFQQQAATLSKAVKQVRSRLAACRTLPQGAGPPKLPDGIWREEKPESCRTAMVPTEEDSEELLLVGHHDFPAELQQQGPALSERDDFYIKIEFEKFCDSSGKDSISSDPPQRPHTPYHTPLTLWTGIDKEESKKQVYTLSQIFCPGWGWDGAAPSLSVCVPTGLRARRRKSGRRRNRGCRRWLSSSSP
ncbi:CCD15 protein, partial [Upupa epops]|nr:CCD15 protein [Upupa epops]